MTGYGKKMECVVHLLVILTGLFLIAITLRDIIHVPFSGPLEILGLILGVALAVVHIVKVTKAWRHEASNFIVLKSETGSVKLHASVVEEALRHTARSLPEVHDVRVKLVVNKQTRVPSAGEVDARIRDLTNIVSVQDTLSRVLAERYQQIIPGAPYIEFHLTIKHHFRAAGKPKSAKDEDVPPDEAETKSIRAPKYPVP